MKLDFYKFYDRDQDVREFLFPTSYLVDEVEEREPFNGMKHNILPSEFGNVGK